MRRFISHKLIHSLIVLALMTFAIFLLLHVAPGDYASSQMGMATPVNERLALRTEFRLNVPMELQAGSWFLGLMQGDWGTVQSLGGAPVFPVLLRAARFTLVEIFASAAISLLLSILLAGACLKFRGRWTEHLVSGLVYAGNALPEFWIALLLVFAVVTASNGTTTMIGNKYAMVSMDQGFAFFLKNLQYLVLPTLLLTFKFTNAFTKHLKAALYEIQHHEFVRVAKAKGLSEREVFKSHLLPNAGIPLLTLFGTLIPEVFATCAVLESIFKVPGLGLLMFNGAFSRDSNLLAGLVVFMATCSIVISFVTDLLYVKVDPRIRYD